jgi:uncharacterized phiE125 gp8 family phage protein
MLYTPTVITPPITEPLSVAEAKAQARISTSLDDALISMYIGAAREYLEWRTGMTVHQQTLETVWDYWPVCQRIQLPRATPLISLTTLSYKDSAGTVTTLAASDYALDTDSMPGGILPAYGTTWPSFTPYPVNAIRARYVCGIATASPEAEANDSIKVAIALIVSALYENREAEVITNYTVASAVMFKYGAEAYILRNVKSYAF